MGSCLKVFDFELNFGYEETRFRIQILIIYQFTAVSQFIQIQSFLGFDISSLYSDLLENIKLD